MQVKKPKHLIDFHVHCFPDNVALKADAALEERYRVTPNYDGTLNGLLSMMDEKGVDLSVIVPVATNPTQVKSINNWAASVASERVISFGAIHPEMENPEQEIARMCDLGLKGIKLQPQWQNFYPDDPAREHIFKAAQGKLIITLHAGDEIAEMKGELKSTPERIANLHAKFPELTIVAAHFGGFRLFDDVEGHLVGREGIYFDTSFCPPEELPDACMLAMIRDHGSHNILFATDAPFGDPGADRDRLMNIGLSQDELEDICWRNAARLLALPL